MTLPPPYKTDAVFFGLTDAIRLIADAVEKRHRVAIEIEILDPSDPGAGSRIAVAIDRPNPTT